MKQFECGCVFEEQNGQLIFDPDITKIPLSCQATWDLIQEGNTKGVFQLESRLGQTKSKDVKPNNIKELSDLIAIIRPGCLESIVDGKNLTQHYIDRKFGKEETDYFHPGLIPILKETYGILVYQEQALAIAKQLAGYSLQEAEILRKAIGKKIIELMGKIKGEFIQKSIELGVLKREEAEEIFSWIEKSQRYSFNACLDPNTVVELDNGEFKTLQEINIGDNILTPTGHASVVDIIDQGKQDVYEIELDSGHTITATLDHKFLTKSGDILPLFEIIDKNLEIVHE